MTGLVISGQSNVTDVGRSLQSKLGPWVPPLKVIQGHTVRSGMYDFLLVIHILRAYHMYRILPFPRYTETGREMHIFQAPHKFNFKCPQECYHWNSAMQLWHRKLKYPSLLCGEENLMIYAVVQT